MTLDNLSVCSIAASVVMIFGTTVAAQPTLRNPGFEQGTEQPAAWGTAMHGHGFTLSRDTAEAHTGTASIKLTGAADHGSRACYLQTSAAFPPEKGLRLKLWYRGTGRADGILRFRPTPGVRTPKGEYGTHHFRCPTPRPDWAEFVFEAGVPKAAREAGAVKMEVILYQRAEGTVWYDDVSLESLSEWKPKLSESASALMCPNRPAQGKVVQQNPPDFSWRPQPGATTYSFQLAPDEALSRDSVVEVTGLRYNVYSHSETLRPGVWHWRIRYTDAAAAASEWTKPVSFTVPATAKPFPVPRPDVLLARIPRGHPRIYATADTLAAFRAPMQGRRAAWWTTFKQKIDRYAERDISKEPPADWVYGFREGPLTDDIIKNGNRLRGYCAGVTSRMRQLAFGYLLSGDPKYAEESIAQMMEMATWDPKGITSYRNHDQVYRDITWKMANAYDWCGDRMTPRQRTTIVTAVEERASLLYRHFSSATRPICAYPYNSHGITAYGFLGICAIALAHESDEADKWFKFIAATYPAVFPPWGDEEGGWCQGVAYWKWSVPFAWWFIDALKSATGLDMNQKAFMRNNGWYKLYTHPPWCDRHHFGDGNHGPPGGTDQSNVAHMAVLYDNPYFQWYAKNLPSWPAGGVYSYWWYDRDLPLRPPADIPQGRYFADIGWVAMHSDLSDPDDVMLMFKSSPFGSFNHSHADQNSFVVYGYGEPLLIDSGYYDWYGSPHDAGWTRQTKAHNNVLVNGKGQPIFDITATGRIRSHFTSPPADYTCGDATVAYQGRLKKFERHILFVRPDVFLIYDRLAAPQPSTFTWCLHAENEMKLRPDTNEVLVERGAAKCLVKFITPTGLTFEQNDQFTPPSTRKLKDEWHAYATTAEKAAEMEFVVLVRPFRASDKPSAVAIDTEQDGGTHTVRLTTDSGRDARIVVGQGPQLSATATRDGRRFAAVVGGTTIAERAGEPALCESSAPITASLQLGEGLVERAWVQCSALTKLKLAVRPGSDPLKPRLDGQEMADSQWSLERTPERAILSLALDPGDHVVEVHPEPTVEALPPDIKLTLNNEPLAMTIETMRTFGGDLLSWGSFRSPAGPARIKLDAPGARVQIGRDTVRDGQMLWLTDSNALMVRMLGRQRTARIRLEGIVTDPNPLVAKIVGEAIAERPGVLKIEAETFTSSARGKARAYSHRTFLSGGKGLETSVVPGQCVEWAFNVAQSGSYHLAVKGAVYESDAQRLIEIDGAPLSGRFRRFHFDFTGGFGATPAEWKHFLIVNDDGKPISLDLSAGKHVLKWTLLARKLNLDYVLLVPSD